LRTDEDDDCKVSTSFQREGTTTDPRNNSRGNAHTLCAQLVATELPLKEEANGDTEEKDCDP
jgi:hypothetical protein